PPPACPCLSRLRRPPPAALFPYTTLFRSLTYANALLWRGLRELEAIYDRLDDAPLATWARETAARLHQAIQATCVVDGPFGPMLDRKSTRLNSSHVKISYAVFCLKKKRSR